MFSDYSMTFSHATFLLMRSKALLGSWPYCNVWQIIWRRSTQNSRHKAFSLIIELEVTHGLVFGIYIVWCPPPRRPSYPLAHLLKIHNPQSKSIEDSIDNHVNSLTNINHWWWDKNKLPLLNEVVKWKRWLVHTTQINAKIFIKSHAYRGKPVIRAKPFAH